MFIITIIETVYLYYMFHIFRTKYSFHHPFEYLVNDNLGNYFEHPIGIYDNNKSKICKFGRDGTLVLIGYLLLRYLLLKINLISKNRIMIFNKIVLLIIFILSWMNLNAVIYYLPFILFDLYYVN
jgi:hypothetical protein